MIRFFQTLMFAGLLWSGAAQACTCAGTTRFAELVKHADLVVEGRVTAQDGMGLVFEVTRTLKGQVPAQIYIEGMSTCSFGIYLMQPGASYVIPLYPLSKNAVAGRKQRRPALPSFDPAACAEAFALLHEGSKLYKFWREEGDKQFYANYDDFIRTLPPAPRTQAKP
jgi:hypothetical protein